MANKRKAEEACSDECASEESARNSNLPEDLCEFPNLFFISRRVPQKHDRLMFHLHNAGLSEIKSLSTETTSSRVAFAWAEMIPNVAWYGKELYNVECGIKNLLFDSKKAIADKGLLYFNMLEMFPEETRHMLAESFDCEQESKLPAIGPDDVFIFRPVMLSAGVGISVRKAPTLKYIRDAVERAQSADDFLKKRRIRTKVLMSRYVADPLLWQGKKFHLRAYFLASVMRGEYRTYLWSEGKVLTAKKPYVNDSLDDKGIHDTHVLTTTGDPFFPGDIAAGGITPGQFAQIFSAMERTMTCVSRVLHKHARGYGESKYAFEVFGVDFLVRRDLSVLLMEINDRVGYHFSSEGAATLFYERYFDWINATIIKPLFAHSPSPPALFEGTSVCM